MKPKLVVASAPGRRIRWVWPAVAAAVVLTGLVASVVFRTANGTLVFDDLHKDAVVTNSKAGSTSFAAAVPANKSSMGGPQFDPWALDWIAAFNGSYADNSPLKHPVAAKPSTRQAFDYSSTVHVPGDDPVFQDAPSGSGAKQHLN